MHFIDEARVLLKAGKGGNGAIAFYRAKFIEFGGPDGGNGGKGADIIFQATRHINTLIHFRHKSHYRGQPGRDGRGDHMAGAAGEDVVIEVPIGTQLFDEATGELIRDLRHEGERFIAARGGRGGAGNAAFKNSIDRAPRKRTLGVPGEELVVRLKLKVLSNVGLVGLPNAGKSTFLAATTAARPKIADYPFTTLSPQLGVAHIGYDTMVIADIPGLIEGASMGLGLGDRFLKHVERCEVLLHLVDAAAEDVVENYRVITGELEEYGGNLSEKRILVALNKADLLDETEIAAKKAELEAHCGGEVMVCSGATKMGTEAVINRLFSLYRSSKAAGRHRSGREEEVVA